MKKLRSCLLILLCLTGCTAEQDTSVKTKQTAAPAGEAPVEAPLETVANLSGEQAYETTCAHCHDTGLNGAPVTRNPADWENRSPLWQAVLMEHAKSGYFGMPPKGGNPDLPDLTVSAAAEYMLEITFPNLPPD